MAVTPKRFYAGLPATGAGTTLYTTPSLTKGIVKNIVISNITTSEQSIRMNVSGVNFLYDTKIPANSTAIFDLSIVLEAGEAITAISGSASALSVFVSGVEVK